MRSYGLTYGMSDSRITLLASKMVCKLEVGNESGVCGFA